MSDLIAMLGALGVLLSSLGAGAKLIYDRLTRRIDAMERELRETRHELDDCARRHAVGEARIAELIGVIDMLVQEIEHAVPGNPIARSARALLARAFPEHHRASERGRLPQPAAAPA